MKRYKLIKEYPGSVKLGTKILSDDCEFVTNYPEFWEEIIEKNYEILKCESISGRGNYLKYQGISSVKRVSDGEVFNIGDKIDSGYVVVEKHNRYIKGFEINEFGFTVICSIKNASHKLENIYHDKTPLFTTEDGVGIYEGSPYYFVCKRSFSKENLLSASINAGKDLGFKYFSTNRAAEEYILMNKPCLSIQDIENISHWDNLVNNLKNIVRSRL